MNSERDNILGRVREALRVSAPLPGQHGVSNTGELVITSTAREWLPPVGDSPGDQWELFARNATELKASFHLAENADAALTVLRELATSEDWQRIATHQGELADDFTPKLGLPTLITAKGYDVNELERCDAGISECDALIAQTGSVLVTSRSAGGRALSVLPPHHVVLARREQLVADLPAAYELLHRKYAAAFPSMISIITGPSRTGDIERILVLGAHGPKKLTIIVF